MLKRNFFNIPTVTRETSKGPAAVPCLFTDGSAVMAFYLSDYDAVLTKLEGTGFAPLMTGRGKALAVLGFFDYRNSTFGPYKEVTLMFPVLPDNSTGILSAGMDVLRPVEKKKTGNFIIDLPITSELSLAAGRELWGYPKFMADIQFSYSAGEFRASVRTLPEKNDIFYFKCPFGKGFPSILLNSISYTCLDGFIRRSVVAMNSFGRIAGGRKTELSPGPNGHRMIKNMRDLGLDRAKPLFVQTTDRLHYILYGCSKIKGCKTPSLPYGEDN